MPFSEISVGGFKDATSKEAIRQGFAEFISTLIFVFAGQGSGMALRKLTDGEKRGMEGVIAIALAHSLGLVVGVAVSKNISGGHVNPAVTFGAFVGGDKKLSLIKLIIYWIGQFLGSIIACLLLKVATDEMAIRPPRLTEHYSVWSGVVVEIVMTFGLVYTVCATAIDPQNGSNDAIAPIAIGFIVGANILAGGVFSGAAMNPAIAFGPAVVSGSWANHWVYWIGPLFGGGLAGFTFEAFMTRPPKSPVPR
ncbi:hypothetical protein L1049_011553 [Liquidambar formosana]|uniref:Uncharacterized protein n=1 Tax=Liquidambar formosana TaxID=63359 RepID=A0AAP0WX39_LIQFO